MNGPVYLYYELDNFYQNHRNYIKSFVQKQLAGNNLTDDIDLKHCDPVYTMKDLGFAENAIQPGAWDLSSSAKADPCGLVAKTYFNDTFQMWNPRKTPVSILENDIT